MKTVLHLAATRGHANFGWLDSYHSFSFGHYYDPERVHFGALRVLNDDTVSAGMGFGKHPHDNMEIVSIPLSGDLHHKDSTGRDEIIREHDVQIMSAGSGIAHSEYNANKDKPVKFLQIWVMPKEQNIEPRYEQKSFKPENRVNQLLTVVAPDNEEAVWINQDAWFSLGNFTKDFSTSYQLKKSGNGVYIFVLEGSLEVAGQTIGTRDGLGISELESLDIKASTDAQIVLIEIPMSLA
ncbi:MAG: hypothetical protein RLY89_545 [Bacteroidota bacterium]|jgi:redox-sensitive bicupin YhaK (pirin superfamily)